MTHILVLGFLTFICVVLPLYSRKYLTTSTQILTGILMGIIVTLNFLTWYVVLFASGSFDITLHLPLQLCHMGNLFILPVMFNRNRRWFDILYFWVMAGTLQAIITPDIQADFPHYWFIRYWVVHGGPVACMFYACIVYELRPTWKGLVGSFLSMNLLALCVGLVNAWIHSNYLYLNSKPKIASLLNFLGEGPWYILGLEVIGFILFIIVYLPFWFTSLRMQKEA